MINFRSYVKDEVLTELYELKVTLTNNEVASIVDAIVDDWNELGDAEADLQMLIEWSVDQYLTHA